MLHLSNVFRKALRQARRTTEVLFSSKRLESAEAEIKSNIVICLIATFQVWTTPVAPTDCGTTHGKIISLHHESGVCKTS
ncbi:uncharacterized protein LY89DRAFT_487084 [Mollisia scopiformis]|uniref:Uncharacterized protein n=1 Tax=Mollisia scopiformis TaxID=149040 RepID=A0A194XGI2_MOLSC|nr:uncharacterized protein LY89DRAFT_487084 [Mollisia scopiformis]KUJ19244.1 hypothetical protein LY89DRAFT_487084 [Mollisia scopiformis]